MRLRTLMSLMFVAGLLALSSGLAAQRSDSTAPALLRRAIDKEVVDGDLKGAIEIYRQVVSQSGSNRALAAEALLRMADAYQKLGDTQAQKIWQQIIDAFSDQNAAAGEARTRLTALRGTPTGAVGPRLVGTSAGRLSSDERTLVFVQSSGEVATRDMATGKITRLTPAHQPAPATRDLHWATSPVLSPDSRQIAYGEIYVQDGGAEFRLMPNSSGTTPRVLFRNPEFTYLLPAAWSPDGKAVLTAMLKKDKTWQLAWVSTVDGAIRVLESLEWRFHDEYDVVNLSPDGRYIAYSGLAVNPAKPLSIPAQESLQRRLYILAADGSSRTEPVRTADSRRPVWTPDSASVVFLSDLLGTVGLWSVPVQGGKAIGDPSIVRSGTEKDISPIAITRSGTMYYSRRTSGYTAVSIRDVNDRGPRASGVIVGFGAVWSPDSKAIALVRAKPGGEPGFNLLVHSFDSGEEVLYADLRIAGASHLWFHDRRRVLVPVRDGAQDLGPGSFYVVDLKNGTSSKILPTDPLRGRVVDFSPDDKILYYMAREKNDRPNAFERLIAFDLATGRSRPVFNFSSVSSLGPVNRPRGGTGGFTMLSPDGRTLAFQTSNDTQTQLGLISLDTGRYEELYRGPKVSTSALQWINGGKHIAWGEMLTPGPPARWRMMRISISGGSIDFTGLEFEGGQLKISPDGSRIADPVNVPTGHELWALDGVTSRLKGSR